MCSFVRQKFFTGSYEEHLDSTISVYETMAIMSKVTDKEMLRAISVMISGEALIYFFYLSGSAKQKKTP